MNYEKMFLDKYNYLYSNIDFINSQQLFFYKKTTRTLVVSLIK